MFCVSTYFMRKKSCERLFHCPENLLGKNIKYSFMEAQTSSSVVVSQGSFITVINQKFICYKNHVLILIFMIKFSGHIMPHLATFPLLIQ